MKKNWKNNRGYRWVGVIIFLFMLGMPEKSFDSGGGNLNFRRAPGKNN